MDAVAAAAFSSLAALRTAACLPSWKGWGGSTEIQMQHTKNRAKRKNNNQPKKDSSHASLYCRPSMRHQRVGQKASSWIYASTTVSVFSVCVCVCIHGGKPVCIRRELIWQLFCRAKPATMPKRRLQWKKTGGGGGASTWDGESP